MCGDRRRGGRTDAQVCCRYVKDGAMEPDCMDAKACKDLGRQGGPEQGDGLALDERARYVDLLIAGPP